MRFNKKNISNLVFVIILILFLIPNTRGIIQIYITRIFSFSPSTTAVAEQKQINDYQWKLHGVNTASTNFKETENKVVLINFWATWCPPCIAEMPSLQELYTDYKDNVNFYFVTTDDDPELTKFMKDKNYNFPIYRSLSAIPLTFEHTAIPATYVLDKEGKLIIEKIGPADWNTDKVRNLLDELLSADMNQL